MKLGLTYQQFCSHCQGNPIENSEKKTPLIDRVCYDTRKIVETKNTVFFALSGAFRNGHHFIDSAYDQGIRIFVVSQKIDVKFYPNAHFIQVKDSLKALQDLATAHRKKFHYPILAITGSSGKTTMKEWIFHLIKTDKKVVRSPKSFNSQLGVALSLLELTADCDLAIIEAGISEPNEMRILKEMIQPTLGVLTTLGRAHVENFSNLSSLHEEKLQLFSDVKKTFLGVGISLNEQQLSAINGRVLKSNTKADILEEFPFQDKISTNNVKLAIEVALELGVNSKKIKQQISTLPILALRLETFDGLNNSLIINDTYNLDLDALVYSLEYQKMIAKRRRRIVLIGLDKENVGKKKQIEEILSQFKPDEIHIVNSALEVPLNLENAVILIKGTRDAGMEKVAQRYKLKRHKTYIEIDLAAVRHNLSIIRKKLKAKTNILAMVKAQSYGSGLEKMAAFLEQQGVNYLGVAYVDEGVELRKHGIKTPILVMNPEEESFDLCIQYQLEPAIYSFKQLDEFIKELILAKQGNFPIHLKFDTGMRRLGFEYDDWTELVTIIQSQPEVRIAGVYSHLADADNIRDKRFTILQYKKFEDICTKLRNGLGSTFIRHILNSEGVFNFSEFQLDMVRVGIAMYGVSSDINFHKLLQPVIKWQSAISQVKTLKVGEFVGYSRTFKTTKSTKIAIIPVGYADGFKRSLSNGKGGVYVNGNYCPTVGRVCMDMIMVNITNLKIKEGDSVEIIGLNQTLEKFAESLHTIPYEVLTSISKRVHRVYLE
ncbi:MAG: alanine racemase [Bacteroidetes bacterium]|nr:alanine racemase [Bacteroidota bacterium]